MATASDKTTFDASNDENALPQKFSAKATISSQLAARRVALSTINDNVDSKCFNKPAANKLALKVIQPAYIPLKQQKPSFAIFEDNQNKKQQDEASGQSAALSSMVTQLYKYPEEPQFHTSLSSSPNSEALPTDSPMLLDTSCGVVDSHNEELYSTAVYDSEIYSHLKILEQKFRPKPTYIRKQPDITMSMRSVLVDWLVDVVESYKMQTATLYLAVSYTDRFLSQMSVLRSKLQLVGTSSLFVAAKYEEIYPPELKDFVYVTDDTYSKKQVLRMEHLILKVLAFDLSAPTAYEFLQRYFSKCGTADRTRHLAEYICELSLLDAEPFLSFLPSITAASSLCLASFALEPEPWGSIHEAETGYNLSDLEECIKCLHKQHRTISETPYRAITEKYKSYQYNCVSEIRLPDILNN